MCETRLLVIVGVSGCFTEIGTGYVEPADLLDRRVELINQWVNNYYQTESMAGKKPSGNLPGENPSDRDKTLLRKGWPEMPRF